MRPNPPKPPGILLILRFSKAEALGFRALVMALPYGLAYGLVYGLAYGLAFMAFPETCAALFRKSRVEAKYATG
jgi:hypothetical protein